jgi:hypothetical protein
MNRGKFLGHAACLSTVIHDLNFPGGATRSASTPCRAISRQTRRARSGPFAPRPPGGQAGHRFSRLRQ